MRNEHLNYPRTIDNTLLIANLFRSPELNAQLTENALVLQKQLASKLKQSMKKEFGVLALSKT